MSILGTFIERENPEFTIDDFLFWMPQFEKYMNTQKGRTMFDNLYPIANEKIFESIFGVDWKQAMSLCIAHYATIIFRKQQIQAGSKPSDLPLGGPNLSGVMSSASIGGFTKTYDLDRSMISGDDKVWWNSTDAGKDLMALLSTKSVPTILVVTSNNIPGNGNY